MVPEWMMLPIAEELTVNQEKMTFVMIAALTIVLMYFISSFISVSASSGPLQQKIQAMENQLSGTMRELTQLQREMSGDKADNVDINENNPILKENELKLAEARQELKNVQDLVIKEEVKTTNYLQQFEKLKQDIVTAKEETRQAEEMMEEMLAEQKNAGGGSSNDDLLNVIKQLQAQFEQQKGMLAKYEPKLKKKDKENKELSLSMRQLRADAANAQLETDKLRKELSNVVKQNEEASSKMETVTKNDDEWKSLANVLQKQLDDKFDVTAEMETQLSELKTKLADVESKLEKQDKQIEVDNEIIKELRRKRIVSEEKDGWEVEGDGWNELEDDEQKIDIDQLKSETEQTEADRQTLENDIKDLQNKLDEATTELNSHKQASSDSREERDNVIRNYSEAQKKLDVLTEFFNKKEAELQKQIGLQSAKFGDVNVDAENTSKRLQMVNDELATTRAQLQSMKRDLEDQERSLKASVGDQEKKAHECWVAARQAERKVTELQVMSIN